MRTSVASTIDFSAGGNGRHCLGAGWFAPEPDHSWTEGRRSILQIAAPFAPFGYFLEFDWTPLLAAPDVLAQSVTVAVDGVQVYRAPIGRSGMIAFLCPPPHPAAERLTVTIDHPDAVRPSERLGGHDGRELALAVRRLRVLNADQERVSTPVFTARATIEGPDATAIVAEAERVTGAGVGDILGEFDLIAGNCNYGLALRAFGFERLSLLQFGGARPEVAIRLLETGFAGIGEQLSADVADNPDAEWMVNDAVGLRFHSGRSSRDVGEAELLAKLGPHLRRLADKLMEDVAADAKIFVYADHQDLGTLRGLDCVLPLYLALRRHGAKRLLWVCPVGPQSPQRDTASVILPGLVQAHMNVLAQPLTAGGAVTLPGWMTALANGWAVFRTLAGQAGTPPELATAERAAETAARAP